MAIKSTTKALSDHALAERMQSILISAVEGQRSVDDDRQYRELRKEMLRRTFPTKPPEWIVAHPTVYSFAASHKGIGIDRAEQTKLIRAGFQDFFEALLEMEEDSEPFYREDRSENTQSSGWTGNDGPAARVKLIKNMLPLADAAVESLIQSLSEPNPNGAPLLDSRVEAIEHLRALHRTIGQLIKAVDAVHLNDGLGQGLAADAARFAKQAARALRDDPVPYVASTLIIAIFEACGIGALGGYIAGMTQRIRKTSGLGE